jgi:hypothetical protein
MKPIRLRSLAAALGAAMVGPALAAPQHGAPASQRSSPAERSAWTRVVERAAWEGRAGLQAAELGGELFVMGGRGPFSPFGTVIHADVWRSSDLGETWHEVSNPAWPARAYFQVVRRGRQLFALGGQNFDVLPNPAYPSGCQSNPPFVPCLPFVPSSTFFNDVWKSDDGSTWAQATPAAGWEGRAGLSAVVFQGQIFVFGGSQGDDVSTGGQGRRLFNDVWRSSDGEAWTRVTANAPWAPRAGAAAVVKNGYIYLLGGERGFTCGGAPGCVPERDLYFNDVWRSRDGKRWDLVTAAAGWSPRPGHQCVVALDFIACFGGYGEPQNPADVWVSIGGARWWRLGAPFAPPWRAATPDDVKYDFDALVVEGVPGCPLPTIFTFGGDRERFELPPPVNATRVDSDVWRVGLIPRCRGR